MMHRLAAENPHLARAWSGIGSGIVFGRPRARVAPEPVRTPSARAAVGVEPSSTSSTIDEEKMNTRALERLGVFKRPPTTVVTDTVSGAPTLDEAEMAEMELMNEIGKWKFNRDDAAARRDAKRMQLANQKLREAEAMLAELRRRTSSSAYSKIGSLSVDGTPSTNPRGSIASRRRVSTLEEF
jgi:hypothetical protein